MDLIDLMEQNHNVGRRKGWRLREKQGHIKTKKSRITGVQKRDISETLIFQEGLFSCKCQRDWKWWNWKWIIPCPYLSFHLLRSSDSFGITVRLLQHLAQSSSPVNMYWVNGKEGKDRKEPHQNRVIGWGFEGQEWVKADVGNLSQNFPTEEAGD